MPIATPASPVPPTLIIPTLDLSPDSGLTDAELAQTLLEALSSVGFLHVKNPGPGLTEEDVRRVMATADELFALPLKEKEALKMDPAVGTGYTTMMGQVTGSKAGRPRGDLKESFSIGPDTSTSIPSTSPSSATPILDTFRRSCHSSGLRLLQLFSLALGVDEKEYFSSRHTYGQTESLRLLHYPALPQGKPNGEELEEGQGTQTRWEELKVGKKDIRAGAHQDFGSCTLLFQTPPDKDGSPTAVEGLEIFVRREDGPDTVPDETGVDDGTKGWWVPAPKPEGVSEGGSMLVNVGVSMEMWSGGKFKATFHRVVFPTPPPTSAPTDSNIVLPGRKSVVCFMIPDLNVLLTPINPDGTTSKGEGCITMGELFKLRMARAYGPSPTSKEEEEKEKVGESGAAPEMELKA